VFRFLFSGTDLRSWTIQYLFTRHI